MWFPRPSRPADLVLVTESGALGREELFALLHDPEAREWRDKVGVSGPREGSAKPSARLLSSGGWVLKTNLDEATARLDEALALARQRAEDAARLRLWHPSKLWAVLRSEDDRFHPTSVCPQLTVIRAMDEDGRRLEAWGRALCFALDAAERLGVGLDVHPSNFGVDAGDALHYLDDELYPPLGPFEIGEAIAGRVPEEERDEEGWRAVGRSLAAALTSHVESRAAWRRLDDGLMEYPLVPRLSSARRALQAGLRDVAHPRRTRATKAPRRTCVIADVHGNLPALDAVLAASRALGTTDYLFLGDAVGYGPHPRECVDRLRELDAFAGVRGNHDHGVIRRHAEDGMNSTARTALEWTFDRLGVDELAWLEAMPRERGGERWIAVHGAPRDPERFYAYVYELTFRENLEVLDARHLAVCFYGHTHVPFVHRRCGEAAPEKLGARDVSLGDEGCRFLVNPGSVGQPRDGDARAAFALWDHEGDRLTFQRVSYPVETTVRDIHRAGLPPDLANRLEMGR